MLAPLPMFAGSIGVVFDDSRFGNLNDLTGGFIQLGTLPLSESAGIAAEGGYLYYEDMGSALYTVDPLTGISQMVGYTGIGTTAVVFGGGVEGLFEIDYASNLFAINPLTGQGTLVGPTGLPANNGGLDTSLSADGTSLLYTAGAPGQSDELYRVNIATGLATDLGSTGVTGIAGSAFVNGDLELFQYGQSANYIYEAPDGSSNFTQAVQLSTQIIDGGALYGASESTSFESIGTPEPATMLLMAASLIALAARRRDMRS
jgi:PEP-CTERM motif